MIHLTLGFDHRIIDGADAGKFMAEVKKYLETRSEDICSEKLKQREGASSLLSYSARICLG